MADKNTLEMESALEKVLDSFELNAGFRFKLKDEQKQSVQQLFYGGDLLAVLPTGFGKSLIFQLLVGLKEEVTRKKCCAIVVCPLKSIVQDQVVEATSLGLKAGALSDLRWEDEELSSYQLLFGSAEEMLEKEFLGILKKANSKLCQNIVAIIVDESHTVESWTGARSTKKGKSALAFRESFGELARLRSYCKTGVPVGAVTGTADDTTQKIIQQVLCLKDALTIYVSPNRPNLRFHVQKVKKAHHLTHLQWLVEKAKELGAETPKTIIFCNTINDMAAVVNYLVCQLGSALYSCTENRSPGNSIIGIYHSNSWQSTKDKVIKSLKGNGTIRIVVATTALCMGVNFPDIRYIINWGPARTILDQHQQAGRAGRDGELSHIVIIYHGQQAGPCEKEVKDFIRAQGCLRVSAYFSLDPKIKPGILKHDCCSHCAKECKCKGDTCDMNVLPFEQSMDKTEVVKEKRFVTSQDRADLKNALMEVLNELSGRNHVSFEAKSSGWFSMALIDDVVQHCDQIFSIDDLTSKFPVFSLVNALRVLEIIQEIFMDIPCLDETLSHLLSKGVCLDAPSSNWMNFSDNDIYHDDSSDSDADELARIII